MTESDWKGYFAENICRTHFQLMGYDVEAFGVEYATPIFANMLRTCNSQGRYLKKFSSSFSKMPDFIMSRGNEAILVEVKYRAKLSMKKGLPDDFFNRPLCDLLLELKNAQQMKGKEFIAAVKQAIESKHLQEKMVNSDFKDKLEALKGNLDNGLTDKVDGMIRDLEGSLPGNSQLRNELYLNYKHYIDNHPLLFYVIADEQLFLLFSENMYSWYGQAAYRGKQKEKYGIISGNGFEKLAKDQSSIFGSVALEKCKGTYDLNISYNQIKCAIKPLNIKKKNNSGF